VTAGEAALLIGPSAVGGKGTLDAPLFCSSFAVVGEPGRTRKGTSCGALSCGEAASAALALSCARCASQVSGFMPCPKATPNT
jgi:hypothetical protein